jgi:hypothetical protein
MHAGQGKNIKVCGLRPLKIRWVDATAIRTNEFPEPRITILTSKWTHQKKAQTFFKLVFSMG